MVVARERHIRQDARQEADHDEEADLEHVRAVEARDLEPRERERRHEEEVARLLRERDARRAEREGGELPPLGGEGAQREGVAPAAPEARARAAGRDVQAAAGPHGLRAVDRTAAFPVKRRPRHHDEQHRHLPRERVERQLRAKGHGLRRRHVARLLQPHQVGPEREHERERERERRQPPAVVQPADRQPCRPPRPAAGAAEVVVGPREPVAHVSCVLAKIQLTQDHARHQPPDHNAAEEGPRQAERRQHRQGRAEQDRGADRAHQLAHRARRRTQRALAHRRRRFTAVRHRALSCFVVHDNDVLPAAFAALVHTAPSQLNATFVGGAFLFGTALPERGGARVRARAVRHLDCCCASPCDRVLDHLFRARGSGRHIVCTRWVRVAILCAGVLDGRDGTACKIKGVPSPFNQTAGTCLAKPAFNQTAGTCLAKPAARADECPHLPASHRCEPRSRVLLLNLTTPPTTASARASASARGGFPQRLHGPATMRLTATHGPRHGPRPLLPHNLRRAAQNGG